MSKEAVSRTRSRRGFKPTENPLTGELLTNITPTITEARTAKTSKEIVQILPAKENIKIPFIHILKKIFDTEDNAEYFHLAYNETYEDFKDMSENDFSELTKDISLKRFLTQKKLEFYYFYHVKPLKSD